MLSGNVIFTKENMIMQSDRARWKDKVKEGTLAGNVKIIKDDRTLTCDSLYYNSKLDLMKTYGRTRVWDTDYDLEADSLIFYSEKDSGDALGNVHLLQKSQDINAQRMTYIKKPMDDAVSYTASGNVIIIETDQDRRAECGQAIYNRSEQNTILSENPKVINDSRQLTGKTIHLYYNNDVLEKLWIPSQSHIVSSNEGWREHVFNDSLIIRSVAAFDDDMAGNTLLGFFTDGKLDSLRLEGMATTLYHIFEDSVYQGNNSASGDTVVLMFNQQDLNTIHILGGARGTYSPDSTNGDLESDITYESDRIAYNVTNESTQLEKQAKIHHATTDLTAGYITVDWTTNMLQAIPTPPGDTVSIPIKPTITEKGDEPMIGESMVYNLKTRKGRIQNGRTKMDDSYYSGDLIRNEGRKEFYIRNSYFTSCDLEDPHFHFVGSNTKMIQKDKIITRPMVFQISHIPIIGLPFVILPNKGGRRHSGWIMPSYGDSKHRGQYLDGGGYFIAPNDYWDTKLLFGFADKQGLRVQNLTRYKKRYWYNGSLHLEGKWLLSQGNNIGDIQDNYKQDIVAKWRHSHTLRHNQTFRASVDYYSNGEYNYQTGRDINERLRQTAKSNISYSKRWKSGASLSLNASADQDLMVNQKIDSTSVFYEEPTTADKRLSIISAGLPNATLRFGNINPFKSKGRSNRWYNNISANYSTTLNRKLKTFYQAEEYAVNDSTIGVRWQTYSDGSGIVHSEEESKISHSYGVSSPFKIFRYISVNPRVSMATKWFDRSYTASLDSATNKVVRTEVMGFAQRTTGSFSMNLNTNIYGLFPIRIGNFGPLHHVITPTIGYSYQPDFSKPVFGRNLQYFETLADTAGKQILSDRFGGTPRQEQQSMNLSLRNILEAKWGEEGKEKVIKLLNWNMRTGYNFAAEEFKLSNLSTNMTTQLGNILKLDLSMTHDFYELDKTTNTRLTTIRKAPFTLPFTGKVMGNILAPRLQSINLGTGFKFSGGRWSQAEFTEADTAANDSIDLSESDLFGENPVSNSQPSGLSGIGQFWSTQFTVNYSLVKSIPDDKKTFWISSSTNFNVSRSWRVSYSTRFDMVDLRLISQRFSIKKDLHCWELSFDWTPTGPGAGYYMRINVKSPNLRDIKLEERGGIQGIRSGF